MNRPRRKPRNPHAPTNRRGLDLKDKAAIEANIAAVKAEKVARGECDPFRRGGCVIPVSRYLSAVVRDALRKGSIL